MVLSSESLESNLHRLSTNTLSCLWFWGCFYSLSVYRSIVEEYSVFMNWKDRAKYSCSMLKGQWTIQLKLVGSLWKSFHSKLMQVFPGMLGVFEKVIFIGKRLIFWFSFLCLSFPFLNMKQEKRTQEMKIYRRKKLF